MVASPGNARGDEFSHVFGGAVAAGAVEEEAVSRAGVSRMRSMTQSPIGCAAFTTFAVNRGEAPSIKCRCAWAASARRSRPHRLGGSSALDSTVGAASAACRTSSPAGRGGCFEGSAP